LLRGSGTKHGRALMCKSHWAKKRPGDWKWKERGRARGTSYFQKEERGTRDLIGSLIGRGKEKKKSPNTAVEQKGWGSIHR